METLDEENNKVNLDNVNISSTQSEANSKYGELLEDYNANIDLTTLLRDKIEIKGTKMKKFGDLLVGVGLIMTIIVGGVCTFLSFITSAIEL